jgi:hypothetical protein
MYIVNAYRIVLHWELPSAKIIVFAVVHVVKDLRDIINCIAFHLISSIEIEKFSDYS